MTINNPLPSAPPARPFSQVVRLLAEEPAHAHHAGPGPAHPNPNPGLRFLWCETEGGGGKDAPTLVRVRAAASVLMGLGPRQPGHTLLLDGLVAELEDADPNPHAHPNPNLNPNPHGDKENGSAVHAGLGMGLGLGMGFRPFLRLALGTQPLGPGAGAGVGAEVKSSASAANVSRMAALLFSPSLLRPDARLGGGAEGGLGLVRACVVAAGAGAGAGLLLRLRDSEGREADAHMDEHAVNVSSWLPVVENEGLGEGGLNPNPNPNPPAAGAEKWRGREYVFLLSRVPVAEPGAGAGFCLRIDCVGDVRGAGAGVEAGAGSLEEPFNKRPKA